MKPARFKYLRAESVEHAVEALAAAGTEAKVLAGGQSLVPMMNFRLVKPSVLVDINAIAGLDEIKVENNRLTLGALVRHRMTAADPRVARHAPILNHATQHVAHLTVRNRGTFCGSICHADPAAEMPMMTLLLDGAIHAASVRGNRTLRAKDFFVSSLVTALAPDEMVTRIDLAILAPETGWGFHEFARRHGDYALAAVAVFLRRRAGKVADARMAAMGIGDTPVRVEPVEDVLNGQAFSDGLIEEAVEALRAWVAPPSDLNASADYRRHLVGALAARALKDAWGRAQETAA